MAKIVRLTESDLTRLVRRVIKEQQTKFEDDLLECAKEQVQISDITKIPPACYSVGLNLMMGKTPTPDSFMKCVKESAKEDPRWVKDKAIGFMTCVAEKKGINIGNIFTTIGGMVGDIFDKISGGLPKGPGHMY
jgi:hypothetical protein